MIKVSFIVSFLSVVNCWATSYPLSQVLPHQQKRTENWVKKSGAPLRWAHQVCVEEGLMNWWLCLQHGCVSYKQPNLPLAEILGCSQPMSNSGMLTTNSLGCTCIQANGDTQDAHCSHRQVRKRLCGSTKVSGKLKSREVLVPQKLQVHHES